MSAVLDARREAVEFDILGFVRRAPETVFNFPSLDQATQEFQSAQPYPHMVVDNFIAKDVIDEVIKHLYGSIDQLGKKFTDTAQAGKAISTGTEVPLILELLAGKLASPAMIKFVESVSGIKSLIPDPYYNTNVGYYHMTKPGGRLSSHVDDSHHATMAIPHSVNIVIYLTPEWDDKHGGAFHLFDKTGRKSIKRVECRFNRALFFRCSPISFHGVEPISPESGRVRHSIYFAYYHVKKARMEGGYTLPQAGHGLEDDMVYHGTYFPMSLRELLKRENRIHLKEQSIGAISMLVPPIVMLAARKFLKR
jgi:hypothetical protein